MKYDSRPNEYDTPTGQDLARMETIYNNTLGRQHPDTDVLVETAAVGALIPPALEQSLQALMSGERSKGATAAQKMRELLGIATPSDSLVGEKNHGGATMGNNAAAHYGNLVDAMKMLLAEAEDAKVMTDFDQDEDEALDMDGEMDAEVNTGDLLSEVEFLQNRLAELTKKMGQQKGVGVNKARYGA